MLEEKIKVLADYRNLLKQRELDYKKAKEDFENSDVVKAYKSLALDIDGYETLIREEAVRIFEETKNKNPHPAVEIKEKVNLIVDKIKAFDYAYYHLNDALTLDRKVFDKVMKVLPEEKLPDGVKIEKVPSAYIKSDLSEYLEKEEKTGEPKDAMPF